MMPIRRMEDTPEVCSCFPIPCNDLEEMAGILLVKEYNDIENNQCPDTFP